MTAAERWLMRLARENPDYVDELFRRLMEYQAGKKAEQTEKS
jgi:hypothetical protein